MRALDSVALTSAQDADVDAIAALHVRSFEDTYSAWIEPGVQPLFTRRREAWRRMLLEPTRSTRLAWTSRGKLGGFLSATSRAEGDGTDLEALYVDPQWQRRGIGSALIRDLLEGCLSQEEQTPVRLTVLDVNEGAIAFYRSFGFSVLEVAGTRTGREDVRLAELTMRLVRR